MAPKKLLKKIPTSDHFWLITEILRENFDRAFNDLR
jgi:hypothetical protein